MLTEVELPSGLALSRWCRRNCPALHQESGAGLWRVYLAHMLGDVSVRDELGARSQSLAERSKSSRWLGQVAGLEKLRLKLNSAPLPHVPSCSSACSSRPLHVSLSMLPIPFCTCPRTRSTCVGADGFYSGSGRLHGSHWSVPTGVSAAHPVSQGSCLFFWPFRSMGSNSSILLCMQQVYFLVASNLVSFMCDPNRPHWVRGCGMVVMGAGGLAAGSAGCRF